jgi:endonuclease-3
MPEATLLDGKKAAELVKTLSDSYKDAHYYLSFKTPVDLVAAAIISAQTRDETVKYKTAKDYASAKPEELEDAIRSVTFAGNKAKNIINTFKAVIEKYNGKVPDKMEQLVELPGIGRKTANTILINAYGIVVGIPVDTWVIKLSFRLGLSLEKNPDKIEQDIMKVVDRRYWHSFAYVLKSHGRAICQAVPYCSKCPINGMCPKNGVTKRY